MLSTIPFNRGLALFQKDESLKSGTIKEWQQVLVCGCIYKNLSKCSERYFCQNICEIQSEHFVENINVCIIEKLMKKSNFCFGDQMTKEIIKSVLAPPVCVFDNFQEVAGSLIQCTWQSTASKTIQNNSKQWPLSETLHSYIL